MNFGLSLIQNISIDDLKFWVLLVAFIFPGYSIKVILDKISLPDNRTYRLQFVDSIYYSVWYFLFWGLFWKWLIKYKVLEDGCFLLVLSLIIGTIVMSAVVIGAIRYYEVVERFLCAIKFQCGKSIPTSWDYIFCKHQPVFVQITLVDGKVVRGLWHKESFASSECVERDIFLERAYYTDKNGDWKLDEGSDGVYVDKRQIRYMEFRKAGEKNVMG